jgi:rare lipoprotein A (peptidoglycan hydrolase)
MRKCRRVLPIFTLCLCTIAAYGQQNWQGNAAVARSGEFATPGMVAASNAFPEDTTILVQNAQTGQNVRVTVVQRIEGAASVFLLLSEEAGRQIGLTGSQVIRVKASVVSSLGTDLSESLREEAYSSDPDLNPPVSVSEEQLLSGPAGAEGVAEAEEPAAEAAGEEEALAEEQPVEVAESEEAPPVIEEAEPETPEEPVEIAEVPAAELTPEEKRLQELTDRIPQKQLYMPPRQQEVYALAPEPAAEEELEEEIASAEQPPEEAIVEEEQPPEEEAGGVSAAEAQEQPVAEEAEPQIEAQPEETVEAVEEQPPEVSMPGPEVEEQPLEVALPGPEAAEPEKPSPEGTRLPAPEEQPPLAMTPEEPPTGGIEEAGPEEQVAEQPVEEAVAAEEQELMEEPEEVAQVVEEPTAAEVAMTETAPEKPMQLSERLPSQTYFVQLGAYSTRNLAEKLAGDLTQNYSVTILPASSGGRHFYKVLVGPLNVDESGTLLYQFRSRGFKDAFIQYVE